MRLSLSLAVCLSVDHCWEPTAPNHWIKLWINMYNMHWIDASDLHWMHYVRETVEYKKRIRHLFLYTLQMIHEGLVLEFDVSSSFLQHGQVKKRGVIPAGIYRACAINATVVDLCATRPWAKEASALHIHISSTLTQCQSLPPRLYPTPARTLMIGSCVSC